MARASIGSTASPQGVEQLIERAVVGIFRSTPEGRYLMANPALARILGYDTPDELLAGVSDIGAQVYVDPGQRSEILRRLSEQDTMLDFECECLRRNGTRIWVRQDSRAVRDESGKLLCFEGFIQDITDRKRTEQELQENRRFSQAIVQATPECIKIVDWSGMLVEMNAAGLAMIDADGPESVVGKCVFDLVAPEDRAAFVAFHERVCGGSMATLDFDVIGLRGRRLAMESHAVPVEVNGQPALLAVTRDVTERKLVETARRLSEFALSRASVAAYLIAPDARILRVNQANCEMLGYTEAELTSMTVHDVNPEFPASVWPAHWENLRSNKQMRFESILRHQDGHTFPVEIEINYLEFEGREYNFAFVRDVTDRNRVERGLRLFRALVDRTSDGIEVIDPATGRFLDVNEKACHAHGYTREEYLRLSVPDVDPLIIAAQWDAVIQQRRQTGFQIFESQHKRKDGSIFPVEVKLNFIQLDREYLVANVRDITERKLLEERLRQSQKMEAIGRLAGGVAHDFNNLLTVINVHAELLLDNLPEIDPGREQLAAIMHAGERAAGLTAQLLAFSRKAITEPKVLDLNQVSERVARMLDRLVGENVRLVTDLDPDLAHVKIDPGQLEQVLMNLVVNARDAMRHGGTLTVGTRNVHLPAGSTADQGDLRPGHYVELSVSDTGEGMNDEVKRRIFEPFFTTKGVGKGTGLGLATVYGIIRQSGGGISVESEVGRGTCFRILFPAAGDSTPLAADGSQPAARRGTETILLAEDEIEVRRLARMVLETHGYVVLEADSGEAAVRVANSHRGPIHLLLADVIMPDYGGRKLAESIWQTRPDIPVLYMSGYTDDAVVRQGIEASASAFLQKPFTPFSLGRKVREALDVARRTPG